MWSCCFPQVANNSRGFSPILSTFRLHTTGARDVMGIHAAGDVPWVRFAT